MRGGKYFGWMLVGLGLAWAAKEEKRIQERNGRSNESARKSREARMAQSRANVEMERRVWAERVRPYEERRKLLERARQAEELFRRRPDLQQQWAEYLQDRFEAPGSIKPVQPMQGKSTGFRGPRGDVVTDSATGDRFEITGGDVADGWYDGSIRVGPNGPVRTFTFLIGKNVVKVDKPLDDASMQALARLFNAASGQWQFASLAKPISVTRPKAEFHGEGNREHKWEAMAEFGERYL